MQHQPTLPLTSSRRATSLLTCATLLFTGALAMPARAQHDHAHHLPNAEDLLDKHVQATGGKQALLALTSRVKKGKLAVKMSGHDFVANVEEQYLAPNKSHSSLDGDVFFQVSVCDGNQAWEWRPGHDHGQRDTGVATGETSFLEGTQKARAIAKADFHAAVNWRDRFVDVETIGLGEVDGAPAYEVKMTTTSEEQYSNFYDKATGRIVKRIRTTPTAMGTIDMEVFYRDYREFDNIWIATTVHAVLRSPSMEEGTQTWTYTDIEHNGKISKSLFDVPEELMGTKTAH